MEKEKGINNLSIIAFVLSLIVSPVGLVLSIISLVKSNNYKKENNDYPKYFGFGVAGLIISIISTLIIIFTLGIIIFVFGILSYNEKYVEGNYSCYYSSSYIPTLKVQFKNNKFIWNQSSNYMTGTYRLNSVDTKNGEKTYKLIIKPNLISNTNRLYNKKNYEIVIKKVNNQITITSYTGTTYRCIKDINTNEL